MDEVDFAKQVFVVLGMSRSGTSAIARALKALGIDLGDKLLPGDSRNPKGFFEDSEILYKINRGVSNALRHPWMSVGLLNDKQIENNQVLSQFKSDAIKILQQRFQATAHWGFKDPRAVTILPFWQSVFKSLDLDDRYVIVMRNPLAAAYSNQKFAKLDIEVGLMLWLIILISSIEGTKGRKRLLVSYELMLKDPHTQLARIHRDLALSGEINEKEANLYANEFIDPNLSHYEHSETELKAHSALAVVPLCLQTYKLLQKLAKDELSFNDPAFQTAWQEIKDEFMKNYPVYEFIRVLHLRNKTLERELRSVHKSIVWKITSPLRKLKQLFRSSKNFRKEEPITESL